MQGAVHGWIPSPHGWRELCRHQNLGGFGRAELCPGSCCPAAVCLQQELGLGGGRHELRAPAAACGEERSSRMVLHLYYVFYCLILVRQRALLESGCFGMVLLKGGANERWFWCAGTAICPPAVRLSLLCNAIKTGIFPAFNRAWCSLRVHRHP